MITAQIGWRGTGEMPSKLRYFGMPYSRRHRLGSLWRPARPKPNALVGVVLLSTLMVARLILTLALHVVPHRSLSRFVVSLSVPHVCAGGLQFGSRPKCFLKASVVNTGLPQFFALRTCAWRGWGGFARMPKPTPPSWTFRSPTSSGQRHWASVGPFRRGLAEYNRSWLFGGWRCWLRYCVQRTRWLYEASHNCVLSRSSLVGCGGLVFLMVRGLVSAYWHWRGSQAAEERDWPSNHLIEWRRYGCLVSAAERSMMAAYAALGGNGCVGNPIGLPPQSIGNHPGSGLRPPPGHPRIFFVATPLWAPLETCYMNDFGVSRKCVI